MGIISLSKEILISNKSLGALFYLNKFLGVKMKSKDAYAGRLVKGAIIAGLAGTMFCGPSLSCEEQTANYLASYLTGLLFKSQKITACERQAAVGENLETRVCEDGFLFS